jgi:phosphatidylglycerol:prolipoprotein diacylglycerol transferase
MANLLLAIDPVAFRIGNIEVAWYAILIVLGMMTSLTIALTQCKRIGLTSDDVIEYFLWVIPIAVVMGRLMYTFVRPDVYFDPDVWREDSTQAFIDMIALWDGGITILGGILGGFFGVIFFSIRMRKKINFGQALDLIVPVLLVGQLFGRVGNFINQEAFGKPASLLGIPEKFPFAIFIDRPSGVEAEYRDIVYSNMNQVGPDGNIGGWFAATFFYEMCWNAVGATIAFVIWRKNKKYPGILAFFYLFWYFLGRALLEYVRIDAVPVTQTLCFVVAPVAVVLGVIYILFRENCIAFKKVNKAVLDGSVESVVLSKWEIDNYNFTAKLYNKPNKFLCWLYGETEFALAEGLTPASKETLEEYKKELKEQEKALALEEKAKNKEEWQNRWQKVKDFFQGKKSKDAPEETTKEADEIDNDADNMENAVDNIEDDKDQSADTLEQNDNESSDKVTDNE